jgi:hypothetical protein
MSIPWMLLDEYAITRENVLYRNCLMFTFRGSCPNMISIISHINFRRMLRMEPYRYKEKKNLLRGCLKGKQKLQIAFQSFSQHLYSNISHVKKNVIKRRILSSFRNISLTSSAGKFHTFIYSRSEALYEVYSVLRKIFRYRGISG